MNVITGLNGVGKTNLLDSIYLLGACRSYFSRIDQQSVSFGAGFAVVHAQFQKLQHMHKASVSLFADKPKKFFADGKEINRASDFFGRFPSVMISPEDLKLVQGGSEERRNFVDSIVAAVDKTFLEALGKTKKLTERRNAILSQIQQGYALDPALLEVIEEELAPLGILVSQQRSAFCQTFKPLLAETYASISEAESSDLQFVSPIINEDYKSLLRANRQIDITVGRTTTGIHKEDVDFLLNGYSLRKFGSQGQQKTFVLALKLAQFLYQQQSTGFAPILLLDDLFDRLDLQRVQHLVSLVVQPPFGQLFITDPNQKRVEEAFKKLKIKPNIIKLGKS